MPRIETAGGPSGSSEKAEEVSGALAGDSNTVDWRELESWLRTARRRASARLAWADRELEEIIAGANGANTDDEHDPEGATIAYERARAAALGDQAAASLVAIDRQLERVEQGTLTVCECCGGKISLERLEAVVTTRRCIECERGRRARP